MTDPQTLLSQAQCYVCLGISLAEALQLALLAQIAGGSSSVGNNNLSTTDANPNTAGLVPPDQTGASWFYQDPATGSGTNVWYWSKTNKNWVQFSA